MNDTEVGQKTIAELRAILASSTGADSVRIRRELAERELQRGEFGEAVELLQAAGDDALAGGQAAEAGTVFHRLGVAQFNGGDVEGSSHSYRRSAECFEKAELVWDRANALWGHGDALLALGRYDECLAATDTAVPTEGAPERPEIAGRVALLRARALFRLDRNSDALELCTESRNHFRACGLPGAVASADDLALSICIEAGDLDRALELANNCYVVALNTPQASDDAYAELRLAETHLYRHELPRAQEFAQQARDRYYEADDSPGIARADLLRGRCLDAAGRLDEALNAFSAARVLFDANGMDDSVRICDTQRARVLHGMRRYQEAAGVNADLAEEFAIAGLAVPEAWAVVRLIENHLHGGDPRGAVEIADKWLSAAPDDDDGLTAARASVLGAKALGVRDLGDGSQAAAIAEEALALTTEDEVNHTTALMYEIRSEALMAEGRDDARDKARRELAHAIALHLAVGSVSRARELSQEFLPDITPGAEGQAETHNPVRDVDPSLGGYL